MEEDLSQENLEEEPRSILLSLISQLTTGMDLHKITLPTFVLEPRSFTEKITDFMQHPDIIFRTHAKESSTERFLDVLSFFLSGWHIRPIGVKKPYNPVLGEFFRCKWQFADGTDAVYVCEQVSHHPPISAYYFHSPGNHILIKGDARPKSKFLGNSAATIMQGGYSIFITNRDEEYQITLPNLYARGVIFGSMYMELGDSVIIECKKNRNFL